MRKNEKLVHKKLTIDEDIHDVNIGNVLVIPYTLAFNLLNSKTFPVDQLIIIVAIDINEYEDAVKSFQERPNSKVTMLADLREMASLTLEENMFQPLKLIADKYRTDGVEDESLYNEIMGMFNRSRIPVKSKPKTEDGLHRKVSLELYKIDNSVKSCGYRYSTLQVFVDDTSNPKINKSIHRVLEQHDIDDFEIVPSIATYKPLFRIGAKAKPNPDKDSYGTVGGYAQKNSKDTCALISRHVAIHSTNLEVEIDDDEASTSVRANLIPETVHVNNDEEVLDISAVFIQPKDTFKFETKFRSEDGNPTTAAVCTYKDNELCNRPVHLWGATTAPGVGIITIPEVRDRDHDKAYIFVEKRVGSTDPLCKEGDSGAMICADDDYGSGVEVISMLIGEDKDCPGKYATFRIDKGLEQLDKQTKSHFDLLKD